MTKYAPVGWDLSYNKSTDLISQVTRQVKQATSTFTVKRIRMKPLKLLFRDLIPMMEMLELIVEPRNPILNFNRNYHL